jgi:predicted alpha/beta-fold hydrolase
MATVVGLVQFVVVVVVAIVVGSLLQSQSFTTVYEYSTDYCPSSQDDHVVVLPDGVQRRSLFIDSPSQRECDQLHIWLYSGALHVNSTRPVIILAHGLGGQKDMGLEKYAVDFAATGYTSVAIDYRTFGGSINCCNDSDVVRNHINPWNHVEDIIATVNWVKSSLGANSIGLWGTSLAGGHMLMVANHFNRDPAIRAVVSQVPHLDGKAASLRAIKKDLFEEMIPKFPLKNCFPDYDGPEGKPYGVFWICIIILMMACLFDQDKFSLPCSSLNVNIAVLWKRTYPESQSTYL